MRRRNQIIGTTLILIAAFAFWEARNLHFGTFHHPGPAYWPMLLGVFLAAIGIATIVFDGAEPRPAAVVPGPLRKALAVAACFGFVVVAMQPFGYSATVAIVTIVLLGAVEQRHTVFVFGAAWGLGFGTVDLIERALHASLPQGFWNI